MGFIVQAQGVDWSGRGYPLVGGFVASDKLVAAFDFGNRTDRFVETSGKGFVAVPYRNKADGTQPVQDATVIKNAGGGLGIIVENGYLDLAVPNPAIPTNASGAFTMMVVGGDSGLPFTPAVMPPVGATICSLADMGNGVSAGVTLPPVLQHYRIDTTLGARVSGAATSNLGAQAAVGIKTCFFVLFDGTAFTYRNMTTRQVTTRTLAELGIVAPQLNPSVRCLTLRCGNYHVGNTGIIGYYPELYQVAKWSKALSSTEMEAQYKTAKGRYASIGI